VVGLVLRLALDMFWPTRAWTCRIIDALRPGEGHRFTDRATPSACCYCGALKPRVTAEAIRHGCSADADHRPTARRAAGRRAG
jgi:hypothetical protein